MTRFWHLILFISLTLKLKPTSNKRRSSQFQKRRGALIRGNRVMLVGNSKWNNDWPLLLHSIVSSTIKSTLKTDTLISGEHYDKLEPTSKKVVIKEYPNYGPVTWVRMERKLSNFWAPLSKTGVKELQSKLQENHCDRALYTEPASNHPNAPNTPACSMRRTLQIRRHNKTHNANGNSKWTNNCYCIQ